MRPMLLCIIGCVAAAFAYIYIYVYAPLLRFTGGYPHLQFELSNGRMINNKLMYHSLLYYEQVPGGDCPLTININGERVGLRDISPLMIEQIESESMVVKEELVGGVERYGIQCPRYTLSVDFKAGVVDKVFVSVQEDAASPLLGSDPIMYLGEIALMFPVPATTIEQAFGEPPYSSTYKKWP